MSNFKELFNMGDPKLESKCQQCGSVGPLLGWVVKDHKPLCGVCNGTSCAWCRKPSDDLEEVWGENVCKLCHDKMVEELGGGIDEESSGPDYVSYYHNGNYFYCRCDSCSNPGPGGATIKDAIKEAKKEGWELGPISATLVAEPLGPSDSEARGYRRSGAPGTFGNSGVDWCPLWSMECY
ncbi:MAG: hypothetical protein ACXABY_30690 [Candidatus Thorarchaeota archaeon]